MTDYKLVPAKEFESVLNRADWRTAKNRAELRHMLKSAPAVQGDAADALEHVAGERKKVDRTLIREVFLRNGFTIKPGHDDLKDYAYEAAFELLETVGRGVQGEPVYLYRRRGLHDFVTCNHDRYAELSAKPHLFETKVLYAAPQPAEHQTAPDVAALVEAAEAALGEIEGIMQEAYNNAHPICCGRSGYECCGSPDPEWGEADQRMMDRLAPHQRALREVLAAHRKQRFCEYAGCCEPAVEEALCHAHLKDWREQQAIDTAMQEDRHDNQ